MLPIDKEQTLNLSLMLGRTGKDDLTTLGTCTGPELHKVISARKDATVVFNAQNGMPGSASTIQSTQQHIHLSEMQAGSGLIQHEQKAFPIFATAFRSGLG